MNLIYIGKIITTHGLKGEIKIKSNFKYIDKAFKVGNTIYLDKDKDYKILSYRKHKDYHMLVLEGISNIDMAISLKKKNVYINRSVLDIDKYIDEDLIGMEAIFNDKKIGIVKSLTNEGLDNIIIRLDTNILIPNNDHFILEVDLDKKKIYFKNLEGLL